MEPCGTGMSIRHRRATAACLDALWIWPPAPPDLDSSSAWATRNAACLDTAVPQAFGTQRGLSISTAHDRPSPAFTSLGTGLFCPGPSSLNRPPVMLR
jgi:hypothetical protein